jgi:magnesium-protoporphyrin IX monomethyl ester (oxidative) cyclase
MSPSISSIKETLLVPRFYKTDFKALKHLNLKNFKLELNSLLKEHQHDYNKYHFIYNPTDTYLSKIKNNSTFIAFLLRSCLAEFSGFLLYTEISKNTHLITNKLLQKLFQVLARDEARHAGIINTYLNEFKLNLNLGNLTKTRPYTYFLPRYVYYSVFLSEKIGY